MNDEGLYVFNNETKDEIEKLDPARLDDIKGMGGNEFKSFEEKEDVLRPILILLEKAEQILSILNLSDNTIRKYNQLKKLTFENYRFEFQPLTKQNAINSPITTNSKLSNSNLDNFWNIFLKEKNLNIRKNQIIEFLLEIIEKFVFENTISYDFSSTTNNTMVYLKKILNDKENILNQQFKKLLHEHSDSNKYSNLDKTKNLEDFEFEIKMEEIKFKEYLNKSEMSYKKFLSNLNLKHSIQIKNSKENNETDINSLILINELENKINEMKNFHNRELHQFRERFCELRTKYNPEIENELLRINAELNETRVVLEKINYMVHPFYEKYYSKNSSWYQSCKSEFKFREIEEINFLICLTNKFFNDNKYLIELVSNLQKEKNGLIEERNLPLVGNSIDKNNILLEISENYKGIECNSNKLYNNFKELMDYINNNFENL